MATLHAIEGTPTMGGESTPSIGSSDEFDIVCGMAPIFEPAPVSNIVEAVGTALHKVGSRAGLAQLGSRGTNLSSLAGKGSLANLGSFSDLWGAGGRDRNDSKLPGEQSPADCDVGPWGLGEVASGSGAAQFPFRGPSGGDIGVVQSGADAGAGIGRPSRLHAVQTMPGSLAASGTRRDLPHHELGQRPQPAPRINELGLPGLLRRRSSRCLGGSSQLQAAPGQQMSRRMSSGADLLRGAVPRRTSVVDLLPPLLADASEQRLSILDFEHLFAQYYVEVRPRWQCGAGALRGAGGLWRRLRAVRSKDHSNLPASGLTMPSAAAVERAWKVAACDYVLENASACQQHWPLLRLTRPMLQKRLASEVQCRDELAGFRQRVVLTLEAERVCHRLLWAIGDVIPPAQCLEKVEAQLQAEWPHCHVRCRDSILRPYSVFSTVLLIFTLLAAVATRVLWCAALAVWAMPVHEKHHDPSLPTRDERLDQLAARVMIFGSVMQFWLLHALAAAFPLRSLHSPFKRDLGCLCAYSQTALRCVRLLGPLAACTMPVAMAIRFDRLGLSLLVPQAGRPVGLHTVVLMSAVSLPPLTAAAAFSVRSSLYSHHQLLIVLLFVSHLFAAVGFVLYFEIVKWAVLGACNAVVFACLLCAKYASEFTNVSLVRAAKLQWACAHMVPLIGLLLAAALEVESGFARALVDFICEAQDVIPTKMCIRMLRNGA